MTIFILAQIIGFCGYIFYITSPYFKTQTTIIQIGAFAYILLCLQWYLLGQNGLLVMNILGLLISIIAVCNIREKARQLCFSLTYPLGLFAIWYVGTNPSIDMLCMLAFILNVASKSAPDIIKFRTFAAASGCLLVITGAMALSAPALIFNAAFMLLHIFELGKLNAIRLPKILNTATNP